MPTGPTGTLPNARNATTRERSVIAELVPRGGARRRAARGRGDPGRVALLVELIETRHRRQSNGSFGDPGADE